MMSLRWFPVTITYQYMYVIHMMDYWSINENHVNDHHMQYVLIFLIIFL